MDANLTDRLLILAPTGQDGRVLREILASANLSATICSSAEDFCAAVAEGATAAIIADEALTAHARAAIADVLARQPTWSDFPLIVMVSRCEEYAAGWRSLQGFSASIHPIVLERPVRKTTFLTAVNSAIHARKRQYEIRNELERRRKAEEALRVSEQQYRALFESIDEGFCVVQPIFDQNGVAVDYRFIETNPAFDRHTGLVEAEGRMARELIPDLEEHWPRLFGHVAITGERERFIEEAKAVDRWFEVEAFRVGEAAERKVAVLFRDITERRRAENELRTSEQHFRDMADNLPLIVWLHDPQGRQEFVNATFCEYFGVTREAMRDHRWQMLTAPGEGTAYTNEFLACVRERRPFHGEVRVQRGDGQWRWLESWARPRFSDDGQYRGHVGASADVTSRKRAEEALRVSEERRRLALDAADLGTFVWHIEDDHSEPDTRMLEIFGQPPNSDLSLARSLAELIHPDDAPSYTKAVEKAIDPGGTGRFHEEIRIRQPDGRYRTVTVTGQVQFSDEPRHALRMVGVVQDVTLRKRAEEALRESERKYATLVENSPDIILRLDRELRHIYVNQSVERYTGIPPESFIGKTGAEAGLQPALWEQFSGYCTQVLRTGEPGRFEFVGDGMGAETFFEARMYPEFSDTREVRSVLAIITDVTDHKLAEAALEQVNRRLEERVRERTAQLERANLALQERAAQLRSMTLELFKAEDRERERIAELLHDDLQQVLVAARYKIAQIESKTGESGEGQQFEQLDRMLGDAIRKARDLSHEMTPLGLLQDDLCGSLERLATDMKSKYDLDVKVACGKDAEPRSKSRKRIIFKAAQELLFNVVKHANCTKAQITFHRANGQLELKVSDEGAGFDAKALMDEADFGHGLGLYGLMHRIAPLGGELIIDSTPGDGTRIRLLLADEG